MTTPIVWHVMIHQPFVEVEQLLLSEICEKFLFGQHDADENVNRTHTHVMLVNPKLSNEGIRRRILKAGFGGRGNYAIITSSGGNSYTEEKLGIYILKGNREIAKKFSYSEEQISEWVSKWVFHPVETTDKRKQEGDSSKSKKSPENHWDVMKAIIAETRQLPGVWEQQNEIVSDDSGIAMEGVWFCRNRRAVWTVMLAHLDKNKIRTSRNELERFYLTMMREDGYTRVALYDSIMKKIYDS